MTNRTLALILLFFLLALLASCLAQPGPTAHAQGPFVTPTPLPEVQATLTTAQQRYDAAQGDLQQAAQFDQKAAELRRNGMAQQQQAQQDIGAARSAVAAQNFEAIGEAIGRANGDVDQLSKTNAAQNDLIATLTANQKAQASMIISLTSELAQLRADLQQEKVAHQQTFAAYNALNAQQVAHQNDGTLGNLITLFAFIVAAILLIVLVVIVLNLRRANEPDRSAEDTPAQNAEDDETPIEGDYRVGDAEEGQNSPERPTDG